MLSRRHLLASGIAAMGLGLAGRAPGGERPAAHTGFARAEVGDLRARGSAWLTAQQAEDGRFIPGERFAVGITALSTLALLAPGGLEPDHPVIRRALAFLARQRQPDGGWYDPRDGNALYSTALVLQVEAVLGRTENAAAACAFLAGRQHHAGDAGDGGFIAEGSGLPDLHATTAAIDGLVAAGIPAQDPHLVAARRFVLACAEGGGAVYGPDARQAAGDHDPTGGVGGAPRPLPYGAMTHAYLADLIVLGFDPADARVQAARAWIGGSWSLAHHPGRPAGRGQEGLYGYYAAVGKTCHLLGDPALHHPDGAVIDWRGELATALRDRAQSIRLPAGGEGWCWRNAADRWGEALPQLSTAYALRCLAWIEEA